MPQADSAARKEYDRLRYLSNREEAIERARLYRIKHREEIKEKDRFRKSNLSEFPPLKPESGQCECCGNVRDLVVDHDHTTGKFRGWICNLCNVGIGMLGDDLAGAECAMAYLNSSKTETKT